MQGTIFQTDFRLLSLGGCNMVLGIQWLKTLGPIIWDFKNLCMEFHHNRHKHVLRGSTNDTIKIVGANCTQKTMIKTEHERIAQLFVIQLQPTHLRID